METSVATDAVYEENTNVEVNTRIKLRTRIRRLNRSPNCRFGKPTNLSRRWSKKQPTKGELCDTFLGIKTFPYGSVE